MTEMIRENARLPDLEAVLELDTEVRRIRTTKLIAVCGSTLTALYALVYFLLGWHAFALYSVFFVGWYVLVALLNSREMTRTAAVLLMAGAVVHVSLCVLFISADGGIQYFLLVVPPFSMMIIHSDDPGWLWTLSIGAVASLGVIEWIRPDHVAPYGAEASVALLSIIRSGTVVITGLFITGVVWRYYDDMRRARGRLEKAHARSESLLLNILPQVIATRLKAGNKLLADDHPQATVLFADIVGFTELSSRLDAAELVALLNEYFSAFDSLVDDLGLEKIKTIGDAYMVAGGVPTATEDHVDRTLRLAQEMHEKVAELNATLGQSLQLRIGLNCGPVTAGVIGKRKFIYDLWGDTVNVASRMESTGVVGRVQVSEAIVAAAGDGHDFESRGMVAVKGKGEMEVYLLA